MSGEWKLIDLDGVAIANEELPLDPPYSCSFDFVLRAGPLGNREKKTCGPETMGTSDCAEISPSRGTEHEAPI